jgi:N-acetylgalactosamine-6-sulfatase
MNRILVNLSIIIVCLSCSQKNPNIVLIVADDLGYGDLGCTGASDIKTPNIDKLAREGVLLTNFYANGPECTPTRTALLTGRYQQRVGGLECAIGAGNVGRYDEAIWLWSRKELGLPVEESTLLRSLKKAGYKMAMLGKWHLGYEKKFRPDQHGFDYSFGNIGYGGGYFYHSEQDDIDLDDFTGAHNLAENGKEVFYNGQYMTDLISDKAIDWLDYQSTKTPFFLYLPYTAAHTPLQGPEDNPGGPVGEEAWEFRSRETYGEMVESLDSGIGKILEYLSDKKMEKETVIMFMSDNGGMANVASNGIYSGHKGQVYEGGIHVPCIIRWPGKIAPNSTSEQLSISFDLTRSIINLSGVDTSGLLLDGNDIVDHIAGKKDDFERTLFWRKKRGVGVDKAIIDGDYKYLVVLKNDTVTDQKLFRLKDDPSELNDLLVTNPEKADELKEKLRAWEMEVTAPRLRDFSKKH